MSSNDSAGTEQPGAPRASLAGRRLGADERDRLLALRAATSEQTPLYAATLAVLVEARAAYRLQMRTHEIVSGLAELAERATDLDEASLRPVLDQLKEWGCVTWVQDPSFRASSIEEYLRRQELWEVTPVGDATLQSILLVLGASERSGSLQRALFRQITAACDELRVAVPAEDATTVYLRLRDLDLAIADLAANARDFYATVNRIAREERIEDHVFLAYKDQLVDYLQTFHDDLVRNQAIIAHALTALNTTHRAALLRLADAGDDSTGLFGPSAGPGWQRRWDGMLDWFVSRPGRRSEAQALSDATTAAIRELLTMLRRLTERVSRPITRADELRSVAAWFARCATDDEAHELFDAAFGLTPPIHLGMALADPDADGRFPSWWETAAVAVPVSLREHGRRPGPGRPPKRQNYRTAKQQLAHQLADEQRHTREATQRLVEVDLAASPIAVNEFGVVLMLLDRALASRPAGETFDVTIDAGLATLRLHSAPSDSRVTCPLGSLTLHGCALEIGPATTRLEPAR